MEPWGKDSELAYTKREKTQALTRISHQISEQIAPLLPQIGSQQGGDSVHATRTRPAVGQDAVTGCASCRRAGEKCGQPKPYAGRKICTAMIRFFQEYISPIDGPRSSFYPTSSQYALDAIQKYGVFRGIALGCDRLMRENGEVWVYERTDKYGIERKVDPVR